MLNLVLEKKPKRKRKILVLISMFIILEQKQIEKVSLYTNHFLENKMVKNVIIYYVQKFPVY